MYVLGHDCIMLEWVRKTPFRRILQDFTILAVFEKKWTFAKKKSSAGWVILADFRSRRMKKNSAGFYRIEFFLHFHPVRSQARYGG